MYFFGIKVRYVPYILLITDGSFILAIFAIYLFSEIKLT